MFLLTIKKKGHLLLESFDLDHIDNEIILEQTNHVTKLYNALTFEIGAERQKVFDIKKILEKKISLQKSCLFSSKFDGSDTL